MLASRRTAGHSKSDPPRHWLSSEAAVDLSNVHGRLFGHGASGNGPSNAVLVVSLASLPARDNRLLIETI
jgi:hypothetical protein